MNKLPLTSTAVLILSCDKYSDIWPTFFSFFDRYWPDCPFPVYLGTNRARFAHPKVKQLFSNRETNWSEETSVIVSQIPEKYLILILEDYFIYEHVQNSQLEYILQVMEKENAAYTLLAAFPGKYNELWPSEPLEKYPALASIDEKAKYRVCLQVAAWNKNVLLRLLHPPESPWEFEIEGSKRARSVEQPFLCVRPAKGIRHVHGPITYYCTALSAGKWMRGAIRLCRKEGIAINLQGRQIESWSATVFRKFYIALPINLRKAIDFIQHKFSFGGK